MSYMNPKTASVTELRQNATQLLHQVEITREPVFILQNSKKAGVLIDEKTFEELLARNPQKNEGDPERYFGRGKGLFGDGLEYQKKLRAEWK